jgi:hypothetical protein
MASHHAQRKETKLGVLMGQKAPLSVQSSASLDTRAFSLNLGTV